MNWEMFAIVLAGGLGVLIWIGGWVRLGIWIQDRLSSFEILVPWTVSVFGILLIPLALAAGLTGG